MGEGIGRYMAVIILLILGLVALVFSVPFGAVQFAACTSQRKWIKWILPVLCIVLLVLSALTYFDVNFRLLVEEWLYNILGEYGGERTIVENFLPFISIVISIGVGAGTVLSRAAASRNGNHK